ncbi:MAG: nitrite/sulfite reductase [Bacteroidetes bacterium]|nr:nitrite/sulfite reductase [Bacteroidota bacterium]
MYTLEEKMVLNTIDELAAVDSAQIYYDEDIRGMREAIESLKRGEISEDEFKRYRLHRGIYGQRPDQKGFNMVRVKIPYGLLTSTQLMRIGEITREFSDGIAHITTRQDIQLHWVKLENAPSIMEKLAEVGLTTREACGNTVRNIVGSPLAGVSQNELFDITPYARLLAKHLLRNQLNQHLPRKFKISFSGSADESDGIVPWIHDIGYVAAIQQEDDKVRKGFKVFVGGGLGGQPRVANVFEEFLPVKLLIPNTEAIITVFNALGNRENRNKARMKYVLWKLGFKEFRRRVNVELSRILESGRTFPVPSDDAADDRLLVETGFVLKANGDIEFNRWLESNVVSQKQAGYNVVYVNPVIGDITADQLHTLGELSERFSNGQVRTTTQQDIVLHWVRSSDVQWLYEELKKANLDDAGAQDISNVTSCPGADTCNLGITHSRALGKELTQLFHRQPDWSEILKDLRIKISGCQNSCDQHHIAAIGLHGATKKVNGGQIPSYIVSIGGGMNSGKHVFGKTLGRIPAHYATEAVSRILRRFLSQRNPDENFWQFAERIGIRSFREDIKDLSDFRPENIKKELFVDLGEVSAFAAVTGEGECAA